MSILAPAPNITATQLRKLGFWRGGWGSPRTRTEKNTNMYEFIDDDPYGWHIMWFPKKFEGWVTPGTCTRIDVRSRVLMVRNKGPKANTYYLSPVLNTMDEFEIFVSQVTRNKYASVRDQLRSGELKYY